MNSFARISQYYYILTVTLSAFHFNYYALCVDPEVPGMQLGTCYRLIDVQERRTDVRYYEQLGFVQSDIIHLCRLRNSPDGFCLVVTKETDGAQRSVCHEFQKHDAMFTFLKTIDEKTELIVTRDGLARWHLSFSAETYDIIRDIYYDLIEENRLRMIAMPNDLQKRDSVHSDFSSIAAQPLVLIDDRFLSWVILHVVNTGGNQTGPVLVILKGKMTVFTAEGDKVYMRLHEFPQEEYFFTCADSQAAQDLSVFLGRYNVEGHAVVRDDTYACAIL